MTNAPITDLLSPEQAAQQAVAGVSPQGLRYATLGAAAAASEVSRLTGAVPAGIAAGLSGFQYVFVPLALSGSRMDGDPGAPFPLTDRTLIAPAFHTSLVDKAICHRNASVDGRELVFLSSRLHSDRFALAFEFFINIAHNFTDTAGVPDSFSTLLWNQVTAGVRGETSVDAWEDRAAAIGVTPSELETRRAVPRGSVEEKARTDFYAAAFSDAMAIYLLSLHMDFDYADLREREYPLLAAPALAERLKMMNKLYPPSESYPFQILYRRRA